MLPMSHLDLQVQGVTTGFVLGRSHVGDRLDDSATVEWLTLIGEASGINITRGGQREGVSDSLDTGTLSATFVNAHDPLEDLNVRPNAPVRLVMREGIDAKAYEAEFAGGPDGWEQRLGAGAWASATKAATGDVHGLYPPSGYSLRRSVVVPSTSRLFVSWTAQTFGGGTATFDVVVGGTVATRFTATSTPTPDWVVLETARGFSGSVEVRLDHVSSTSGTTRVFVKAASVEARAEAPLYTGTLQDVVVTEDQDGNRLVSVSAVDSMASLTGTQRYGAVTDGGAGYETWAQRINRLRASAQVPIAAPEPDAQRLVYSVDQNNTAWRSFGTTPSGLTVQAPRRTTSGIQATETNTAVPVSWAAQARGYEVTVAGLTVGATYRLTGTVQDRFTPAGLENTASSQRPYHWQAGIVGKGYGAEAELPVTKATGALGAYVFVATSTSHVVRVTNSRPVSRTSGTGTMVALDINVQVREVTSDPYLLRDVVYESNLASHFDLACTSVGARWWIDKAGVVQFARAADRPDLLADLSDVHTSDPLHACYGDVVLGYDTKNAVNNVSITNHGRRYDAEQSSWLADDQVSVHADASAIANWGARSASADVSLYLGAGHESDLTTRATAMLAASSAPAVRPTSVRFDALRDARSLALARDVDQYARLSVTRRGVTYICRVVGISHEISPETWTCTLTLREDF